MIKYGTGIIINLDYLVVGCNLNDKGTIEFQGYEVAEGATLNQKQDEKAR